MGKLPTKKENNGKMTAVLGNRTTAVHVPLEDGILVRIQVPQLKLIRNDGLSLYWTFDKICIKKGTVYNQCL